MEEKYEVTLREQVAMAALTGYLATPTAHTYEPAFLADKVVAVADAVVTKLRENEVVS